MPKRPVSIISPENRALFTKIIIIYAILYVVMKLVAIFRGAWIDANLLLCLPYVLVTIIGGVSLKRKKTSWIFVWASIVLILVIRFYETGWMIWLHENL